MRGNKGDSYDNTLAEMINGLYKAELIHRRARWETKESLKLVMLEWASWFDHDRLHFEIARLKTVQSCFRQF